MSHMRILQSFTFPTREYREENFKLKEKHKIVCKSCRKHKIHKIDDVDRKFFFIPISPLHIIRLMLVNVAMLSNLQFFIICLAGKPNDLWVPGTSTSFICSFALNLHMRDGILFTVKNFNV